MTVSYFDSAKQISCLFVMLTALLVVPKVATGQTAQARLDKLIQDAGVQTNGPLWLTFKGNKKGIGAGKHIVLIAGDDEYRSEQSLPMLGKILAVHHGFECTVLFPIEPKTGHIKPDHQTNIPGMKFIESADLLILGLRFRNLPDSEMKYFADYVDAGKPIIGIRTSTHAFNYPKDSNSKYKHYGYNSPEWPGGFGQQVLGDTWISHHGDHNKQSCRGVVHESNKSHPILKGIEDVWGPSDVYGIRNLPDTATVLLDGAVLSGMKPADKPVAGKKNDPMMPVAWTKGFKSKSGKDARIFCTTMGASTDFKSEGLRRLIVNASFWCVGLEDKIPAKSNVELVDDYNPTDFGFGTFAKGQTPADFDLNQ